MVPLVKNFDKGAEKKYSISKRKYIKNKLHLSIFQDRYCFKLNNAGFKLERGNKNTGIENLSLKQLKGIIKNYERFSIHSINNIKDKHSKIATALSKVKKKTFSISASVIIDGETYHTLPYYLNLYTKSSIL